ncbi:MAG: hypothetical protein V4724_24015 [Pseudomonadota bacterium]
MVKVFSYFDKAVEYIEVDVIFHQPNENWRSDEFEKKDVFADSKEIKSNLDHHISNFSDSADMEKTRKYNNSDSNSK